MPKIDPANDCQTVITTFECSPATCHDLMEMLQAAYDDGIRAVAIAFMHGSRQPGFIAAGLHVNDARTRIANYSQWARREDFQAMLRTEEMRRRNREIAGLCTRFEPVMYEVTAVF